MNPYLNKKVIVSKRGQWDYPGQDTIVPTTDGSITMQGVNYPVYGQDETGYGQMMYPNQEYKFPGKMVYETPMSDGDNTEVFNKSVTGATDWFASLLDNPEYYKRLKNEVKQSNALNNNVKYDSKTGAEKILDQRKTGFSSVKFIEPNSNLRDEVAIVNDIVDDGSSAAHVLRGIKYYEPQYNSNGYLTKDTASIGPNKIGINPIMYNPEYKNNLKNLLVHEIEHSTQIAQPGYVNPYRFSKYVEVDNGTLPLYKQDNNITPYAEKVIKENILSDDPYYSDIQEVMSGKRQIEHMLENVPENTFTKQWKYGDKIDDEHFNYIFSDDEKVSFQNDNIRNALLGDKKFNDLSSEEKVDLKNRLSNIMMKIAMENSKNPYTDYARNGTMIKRADGSYSQRGLWDNIRANKGSGKKPTEQMLEQEKKIKKQEMQSGGKTNLYLQAQGGTQATTYSWATGSNAPQTTQPVNTLGSGHSQTLPSTYKPVGDLTKVTKEKPKGSGGSGDNLFMQGVGAVDKAIGQGASYLLGAAGEAFTAPASAAIESFHYLSGKPYNFGNAMPNPGRISAYASGDSDLYKDNRQKTLTELAGVNRENNPVGATILDVFTPTLPIASMGKAATASNAIKYAPKANALTNLVTDPYSFIKTMNTPTVNPNVGLKFVDETIDSQKALQRVNQNVINPAMNPQLAVNATQAVAKEYTPWTMQEMPGLHLQSTMSGGPIEQMAKRSKTGDINVQQALAIIKKESSGTEKEALIRKAFGENIPEKMNYNDFRKVVQDQIIPLENNIISSNRSKYGINKLGYTMDDYDPPLENKTMLLSNKNKFGRGSSAHDNPEETLGHIHFLRDTETPDILTVTQIQSDAFQGTYRIMPKAHVKMSPLEQVQRSYERMQKLQERNKTVLNKMKTEGLDEGGVPVNDYQIKQFEDYMQRQEEANAFSKSDLENFNQKQLLDKSHQERYLQELVDYAGKRGDVNKVRLPTSETAAKIQGHTWRSSGPDDYILDAYKASLKNLKELNNNPFKIKDLEEKITILKKYEDYGSMGNKKGLIEKLYGKAPNVVTDAKGNTWYEFDIPDAYKQGKAEIKAFDDGGKINPYLQARSGIYIKPENRGKFTSWAQNHDMGVQEAASKVMTNKEEYSPSVVKMANFAKNSAGWKKGQYGLESNLPEAPKNMFSDYNPVSSDYTAAMNGMMKARMATDAELGNTAAKRMTSLYPKEYTFTGDEMFYDEKVDVPAGATGTHYTTGDGNVMFPIIQEGQDGNLFFNRYANPYNKEAMRFESPQDASYFGENYKNIAPMMYNAKEGQFGLETTKEDAIKEIDRNVGYIMKGKEIPTGVNMTKLNPDEEYTYKKWVSSLTPNLSYSSEDKNYDTRGAWKTGVQPELFDENFIPAHEIDVTQERSIYEPHLFTNDPQTGRYLKGTSHPSYMHAIIGDMKGGYIPTMDLKGNMYAKKMQKGGEAKKVIVDGKEYDTNSNEYRKLYNSGNLMSVDAEGVPTMYKDSSIWDDYYEEKRKNKGADAVRKGTSSFINETSKLIPGNPNVEDSFLENILEVTPTPLGRLLSMDDAMLATNDMMTKNENGYFNNALDIAGVTPYLKMGSNTINTKLLDDLYDYYKNVRKRKSIPMNPLTPMIFETIKQSPKIVNYGLPGYSLTRDEISRYENKYGKNKMSKGGESDLVPVEVERSERIYDPKGNLLKEIPADAPTHEEGGVKLHLREGTLVFPKKYYKALDMASTLPEFNKIKEKMLDNAEKAYLRGEPYSSGGKRS